MKHVKVNILNATISLIAALFSCSLNAMTAIQPKGTLSMERRQKMLATIPKGKILEAARTSAAMRKKTNVVDILATASCKENEFFIHEQGSYSGICVSPEVVKLCGTLDVKIDRKIIPIYDFSNAVIKNTFDVLKIYEPNKNRSDDIIQRSIKKVTDDYSREQLIEVANCISYLNGPEDVQKICLDEIKNKYKGNIQAIISNEKLNADLRQSFIAQPAVDCLTSLLEKNNILTTKKIFRDYSASRTATMSVGINSDGTRNIEGLRNSFIVRDASGNILMNQGVGFNVSVVAMSPDGTIVAVGAESNNLELWDVNTKTQLHNNLVDNQGIISSLAFSSDGTKLASGGWDTINNLKIWDVSTGAQTINIQGYQCPVDAVAFSSDSTKLIVGYSNRIQNSHIVVWDIVDGSKIKDHVVLCTDILSVSPSPDNTKILYVARPQIPGGELGITYGQLKAFLLDTDTGASKQLTEEDTFVKELRITWMPFTGENRSIPMRISFARNGRKIIIGEMYGIRVLGIDNNYNVIEETFLKIGQLWNQLRSMAVSLDGRKVVSGYISERQGNLPAFVEYTLWTNEDEAMTKRLKDGTFDETELTLKLCSEFKKQGSVKALNENDAYIFQDLPASIQQKLSNIFWPPKQEGWLSGWW